MLTIKRRAFTLIEICVVVFVIGLLSGLVYMQWRSQGSNANQGIASTNVSKLRIAVGAFFNDTGLYPASLNDLTLSDAPANGFDDNSTSQILDPTLWHGPYLREVDVEPVYGTSYTYTSHRRGSKAYYTVDPVNWNP